jgi:hypothetical protein
LADVDGDGDAIERRAAPAQFASLRTRASTADARRRAKVTMTSSLSLAAVLFGVISPSYSKLITPEDERPPVICADPSLEQVAEADTAACLAQCKRDFESCSNGGTKDVPACIKKRKECIDSCK